MALPRQLEIAIEKIGKLHDGPDVVRLAGELAAAYPHEADYWDDAGPDTPWCGISLANWLTKAGYDVSGLIKGGVGLMYVNRWLDFGSPVPVSQRQPGDIAIYLTTPHHVTMVGDQGDYVGGNQSDGVTRAHYRAPDAVRRPVKRIGAQSASPAVGSSSGKGSWYSQFSGKYQWVDTGDKPNSNALGVPDSAQGISFYDHSTLGDWFAVTAPNGVASLEQQTDIGPSPSTGRTIDISAACAERLGYSPSNFPTDSIFHWTPINPPAAVASLTPKQQATAFRDLRKGSTMTDPAPTPLPAPAGQGDDFMQRVFQYFMQNPEAFQRIASFMAFIRTGQAPTQPPTPTVDPTPTQPAVPVTPAMPKWGLGTGILGTLLSGILMKNGSIPPALGDGSTLTGLLSLALPAALAAFGVGSGPAAIIAKLAPAVFAVLTQVQKK